MVGLSSDPRPAPGVSPDVGAVRRLGVVDHVGNDGGGSRFLRGLLLGLRSSRPDLDITLFANARSLRREGFAGELSSADIRVSVLRSVAPPSTRLVSQGIRRLRRAVMPERDVMTDTRHPLSREIRAALAPFDVAYFPWPYGLPPLPLPIPSVATVHDLNFRYFFGAPVWDARDTGRLTTSLGQWLERATCVVSSDFMAHEVAKFYPDAQAPSVIRLAPFAGLTSLSHEQASLIVRNLGIDRPYLLYPTHPMVHKNLGPLIAALAILRGTHPDLQLVLTGGSTEAATGTATAIGVERGGHAPDVVGLGYVSNDEMDALISQAAVVVTSSLYEAGAGPGLDAWALGTPVAMSDIPPFREHLAAQGVSARLFDPRSPRDIGAKVGELLDDPDEAKRLATLSRHAIAAYTWERTASEYLGVFDRALDSEPSSW